MCVSSLDDAERCDTDPVCMAVLSDGRICGAPAVALRGERSVCGYCFERADRVRPEPLAVRLAAREVGFVDRWVAHLRAAGSSDAQPTAIVRACVEAVVRANLDLGPARAVDELRDLLLLRISARR